MNLKVSEIAKALGTVVNSENIIKRVSIDSRDVDETTLFVAIHGERFDGHDFIESVCEKGVGAVISHKDIDCSSPLILVNDTKSALLELASYYRCSNKELNVIGLTGSVGKTTTKEMVACVMEKLGETLKTEGNLNNDIGVPRTLFRLENTTENAVIEMGMDGAGQISVLTKCAKPDCAIITNIGVSHIENLGSREGILNAKLEILEGMKKGSTVFLNGDNDMLSKVQNDDFNIIFFGIENKDCHVLATHIAEIGMATEFVAVAGDVSQKIKIPTVGIHNVYDALTAFAVGIHYGIPPEKIAEGLENYVPSGMRQKVCNVGSVTVIEDCYNASPDSQKAGLNSLSKIAKNRKIAVLGDMLELGSYSETAHRNVGSYAAETGVDMLFTYGNDSLFMADEARKCGLLEVLPFTEKEKLTEALLGQVRDGDTILFKASRGMRLEEVIEKLYEKLK